MKPKICVVLIDYNSQQLTQACIDSLNGMGYPNLSIIVVLNGDQKGLWSGVEVVRPPCNGGTTMGNNVGMRVALDLGADYVWLLNNDTEVRGDAAEQMLKAYQPGTLLSSIITYEDGERIWCNGLNDIPAFNFPKSRNKGQPVLSQAVDVITADYTSGCSMFFERAMVRMFDESYFMYFDDLEFSHGQTNLVLQQALVRHKVSSCAGFRGSGRFTPLQAFHYARNGIKFYFGCKKISLAEKLIYLLITNWVFVLLYVRDRTTLKAHFAGLTTNLKSKHEKQ